MPEMTLEHLVADLVGLRHAGGYRFKVQERVLRQFVDHCRWQGYPDGSITKEAVDGFCYSRHLRSSTARRNELALRQLAEHAKAVGWDAYIPVATTWTRVRHQPPYVLSDDEVRRLFAAIDSQVMSSYSNKALVDPVLFRVLYGAGLRILRSAQLEPVGSRHECGNAADPRLEERHGQDHPDHRSAQRDPGRVHRRRAPEPRAK